jgi:hypothetical protein
MPTTAGQDIIETTVIYIIAPEHKTWMLNQLCSQALKDYRIFFAKKLIDLGAEPKESDVKSAYFFCEERGYEYGKQLLSNYLGVEPQTKIKPDTQYVPLLPRLL